MTGKFSFPLLVLLPVFCYCNFPHIRRRLLENEELVLLRSVALLSWQINKQQPIRPFDLSRFDCELNDHCRVDQQILMLSLMAIACVYPHRYNKYTYTMHCPPPKLQVQKE